MADFPGVTGPARTAAHLERIGPARTAAYLEREEGLEVVVDLSGVGSASPVAGQVVGVCHHLQQSQLRVRGCPPLLYEGPTQGQNDPQHRCPPAPGMQAK